MSKEGGSMAVAMSGAVAIVAVLGMAVAAVAVLYAGRAQAANAADAAALAAAVGTYPPAARADPVVAATEVARLNGAVLLGCRCPRDLSLDSRTVEVVAGVTVEVPIFGTVMIRGVSRAEFDPLLWLGGP